MRYDILNFAFSHTFTMRRTKVAPFWAVTYVTRFMETVPNHTLEVTRY